MDTDSDMAVTTVDTTDTPSRIRIWPLLWWILRIPLCPWLRIRPFRILRLESSESKLAIVNPLFKKFYGPHPQRNIHPVSKKEKNTFGPRKFFSIFLLKKESYEISGLDCSVMISNNLFVILFEL